MYASKVSQRAIPASQYRRLVPGRFIIYYNHRLKRDMKAICITTAYGGWVEVINLHTSLKNRLGDTVTSQIKVIGEMAQYSGPALWSNQTGPLD